MIAGQDRLNHGRVLLLVLFICGVGAWTATARAEQVDFYVDSSESYLTLAIPNFTYSSSPFSFSIAGQNRATGAPVSGAWSATTGNTAFITGSFSTAIDGDFGAGLISSVQFLAGTSTMTAFTSGNYRPNPTAFNGATNPASFSNNNPAPADYGAAMNTQLGDAGLFSLSHVGYDLNTTTPLPVVGNQFPVNLAGDPLVGGISGATLSLQSLDVAILGALLTSTSGLIEGITAGDTSTNDGTFVFSPFDISARLTIPIAIPFTIAVDQGPSAPPLYLNGTATGQIVANSPAPEPSTLCLAGVGLALLAVVVRRGGSCRRASGP